MRSAAAGGGETHAVRKFIIAATIKLVVEVR